MTFLCVAMFSYVKRCIKLTTFTAASIQAVLYRMVLKHDKQTMTITDHPSLQPAHEFQAESMGLHLHW